MFRNLMYVIFVVKCLLFIWGLLGLIEYFVPSVSFGLQEVNFPAGVQLLHWLLLLLTGSIFIAGFLLRWRCTPFVTVIMYATLATLCFVETIDFNAFGGGPERFFIMAAEYLLYVLLSAYLLHASYVKQFFR